VRLHDLRHLAATLMLTTGVPLALVSKVLRHPTSGITVDLYGHLTAEAALAAVDSLGPSWTPPPRRSLQPSVPRALRPHCDRKP